MKLGVIPVLLVALVLSNTLALSPAQESESIQKGQAQTKVRAPKQYPDTDGWSRVEKTDPLTSASYVRFVLRGKFLQPPRQAQLRAPYLVVECDSTKTSMRGRVHGKLRTAYIDVGVVMDSEVYVHEGLLGTTVNKVVAVRYRRDDELKIQSEDWERSTDFSALFLGFHVGLIHDNGEQHFSELLYSHAGWHKEGSSPQVRKAVISVPEYLGADVVLEFDFPDSMEVADSCGLILHKK